MIEHVVRRSVQHASGMQMFKRTVEGASEIEMPKAGIAVLFCSFIVVVVFLSCVRRPLCFRYQAELRC